MKRTNICIAICCAAALLVLLALAAALCFAPRMQRSAAAQYDKAAARDAAPDDGEYALFPGLSDSAITAISIASPDCSYEFRCSGGEISVNGREADPQIFRTLVSQISKLPASPAPPPPKGGKLQLSLVISCAGGRYHASFYSDGGSGATAYIAAGEASSPTYHLTDGWRIGTLMMTCEGTRIQDEHGNEMPAD